MTTIEKVVELVCKFSPNRIFLTGYINGQRQYANIYCGHKVRDYAGEILHIDLLILASNEHTPIHSETVETALKSIVSSTVLAMRPSLFKIHLEKGSPIAVKAARSAPVIYNPGLQVFAIPKKHSVEDWPSQSIKAARHSCLTAEAYFAATSRFSPGTAATHHLPIYFLAKAVEFYLRAIIQLHLDIDPEREKPASRSIKLARWAEPDLYKLFLFNHVQDEKLLEIFKWANAAALYDPGFTITPNDLMAARKKANSLRKIVFKGLGLPVPEERQFSQYSRQ